MIKKIFFYIFLFFVLFLNILIDTNINNYFKVLEKCFGETIQLSINLYVLICSIIALISAFIILDILLVAYKKNGKNKDIKFKEDDGTYGTANWMTEKEISEILGLNDVPGIILGKYNKNIVKLTFDSYFNKNICVFR